jgi:hypothetical protein
MPRPFVAALCALLCAPALAAAAPVLDTTNTSYSSTITSISPSVPGVSLQVLDYNDELTLTNHSGRTVTVQGYDGEPYLRILADGTVQVNKASPAYYLNQNFYGNVTVPLSANAAAAPQWVTQDKTATYTWHDHRIHWMSPVTPPMVKDVHRRTHIFNWVVPVQVGSTPVSVNGTLYWVGKSGGGFPAWALISMIVIVVVGLGFGITVQRRRIARAEAELDDAPPPSPEKTEAW